MNIKEVHSLNKKNRHNIKLKDENERDDAMKNIDGSIIKDIILEDEKESIDPDIIKNIILDDEKESEANDSPSPGLFTR